MVIKARRGLVHTCEMARARPWWGGGLWKLLALEATGFPGKDGGAGAWAVGSHAVSASVLIPEVWFSVRGSGCGWCSVEWAAGHLGHSPQGLCVGQGLCGSERSHVPCLPAQIRWTCRDSSVSQAQLGSNRSPHQTSMTPHC